MAAWDDLQQASVEGEEFDFISIAATFSQQLDEQRFHGRNGAFLEPAGEKAQRIEVVSVFFGDDYIDQANRVLAIVRAPGIKKLVHPVHGELQVAVEQVVERHDVEDARDCASYQFTFVEHTDRAAGPITDTTSVPALANAARTAADATTQAALSLDAISGGTNADATTSTAISNSRALATSSLGVIADLEENGDDFSLAEIQARVNTALSTASSIVDMVADYTSPETYSLGAAVSSLAQSVSALGAQLVQNKPPLITFVTTAELPLRGIAFGRYGDGDRAEELLALNAIEDPLLVPRGTTLTGYAS